MELPIDSVLEVLSEYKLCDRCFGKLYCDLEHIDEGEKGRSLKIVLYMEAHRHIQEGDYEYGVKILKILAENGNFQPAFLSLKELNVDIERTEFFCDLCTGKISLDSLRKKVEL